MSPLIFLLKIAWCSFVITKGTAMIYVCVRELRHRS